MVLLTVSKSTFTRLSFHNRLPRYIFVVRPIAVRFLFEIKSNIFHIRHDSLCCSLLFEKFFVCRTRESIGLDVLRNRLNAVFSFAIESRTPKSSPGRKPKSKVLCTRLLVRIFNV